MKKLILGLAFALVTTLFGSEIVEPVASQLRPRQPEWHPKIIDHFENGSAKMALFFEDQVEGEPLAVKRIHFYEDGKVAEEIDLTEVVDGSDAALEWESTSVPHGLRVYFTPKGQIAKVACYDRGVLHGPFKSFFSEGKVQQEMVFDQGKRTGEALTYYDDGSIAERAHFKDDKAVEEIIQYYTSGNRKMVVPYKDGLVEGKVQKWFEDGSLMAEENYAAGKLHSIENVPAHVVYDEEGSIRQINHYEKGEPSGIHTSYHPNGQQSMRSEFKDGKMHGNCEIFSTKGELIGEGKYNMGTPFGKHYRNHESGELAYVAKFNDEGALLEPILEYNSEGTCTARYEMTTNNTRHGPFQKWNDEGVLEQDFNYVNGEFEGKQAEYYPDGSVHRIAHYENLKKHGSFVEFDQSGQQVLDLSFVDGVIDGIAKEWYADGTLKSQKEFDNGKPIGNHTEWFEDGSECLVARYVDGQLDGEYKLFNEEHKQVFEAFYVKGALQGVCRNYHDDGSLKEHMEFVDNLKTGKYELYYPSGKLQVAGSHKNDQYHGLVSGYYEDGSLEYERYFDMGQFTGEQKEYFKTGMGDQLVSKIYHYNDKGNYDGEQKTFYESGVPQTLLTYDNGKLHGMKALWSETGDILEEAWYENDMIEGRFYERDPSGREVIAFYEHNQKEGPYEVYFPEHAEFGKVKAVEGTYKANKLEGEMVEYNERGDRVGVTLFANGLKNGISQLFGPEEQVLLECEFLNDKRHGLCREFFGNGKLKKEAHYSHDVLDGEEKIYYENGQLASKSTMVNGKLEGLVQNWNSEGILTFEGEYSNGERHGKFNKFYEDGSARLMQFYKNDQLDGVKKLFDKEGVVTETNYEAGKVMR